MIFSFVSGCQDEDRNGTDNHKSSGLCAEATTAILRNGGSQPNSKLQAMSYFVFNHSS